MDIKGFILDHVGHFAMQDVLGLIFSTLVAAFLGWLLAVFGLRLSSREARSLVLWSSTAALGVGFIKAQLPLALALVAMAMLVGGIRDGKGDRAALAGALFLGLGCGSGAAMVTVVVAVPYLLIVRWVYSERDDS